jgi:hypothetical protein
VTEAPGAAQDAAGDIDLTREERSGDSELPIGQAPYDPTPDRERMRDRIAGWLLGLLIGVIAAMLAGLATGRLPIDALEKIAAVILSPVIGLFGAVVGFYYGEQSRRHRG